MKFKKNLIVIMRSGVVVNCDTEEKAEALLKELAKSGIKWPDGIDLLLISEWKIYESKTCYNLGCKYVPPILTYGSCNFYEEEGYKIIKFEELLEDENENDIISHPAHYCHSK